MTGCLLRGLSLRGLSLLGLLLPACHRAPPASPLPAPPDETSASGLERALALWSRREEPASLTRAIAAFEEGVAARPTDWETRGYLVRAEVFQAGERLPDRSTEAIEGLGRAVDHGRPCLAPTSDEQDAQRLSCIYWTAEARVLGGEIRGPAAWILAVEEARPWMERVARREPAFFYGGPERFMGRIQASLPTFAGRDLPSARTHFDRALLMSPDFLANRVDLARTWAVQAGDPATWREQLQRVVDARPDLLPAVEPEQAQARRAAARLLGGPPPSP